MGKVAPPKGKQADEPDDVEAGRALTAANRLERKMIENMTKVSAGVRQRDFLKI